MDTQDPLNMQNAETIDQAASWVHVSVAIPRPALLRLPMDRMETYEQSLWIHFQVDKEFILDEALPRYYSGAHNGTLVGMYR